MGSLFNPYWPRYAGDLCSCRHWLYPKSEPRQFRRSIPTPIDHHWLYLDRPPGVPAHEQEVSHRSMRCAGMQGGRRLTQQSQGASTHEPEAERREARAHRILDAASTLILRYGYHKTTIDDIARQAGVGKGTLYLHWKTREDLFTALILREKLAMAADLGEHLAHDPAGATLRGLLKHSALALMQRPLLKAVIVRDRDVLGNLIEREQSNDTSVEVLAGFTAY